MISLKEAQHKLEKCHLWDQSRWQHIVNVAKKVEASAKSGTDIQPKKGKPSRVKSIQKTAPKEQLKLNL